MNMHRLFGTLTAVALVAASGTAVAQDTPKPAGPSTVEIGAATVSDGSYKAGEYNGLENKGGLAVGNVDFRNAVPYNSKTNVRWRVKGIDLGLETRNIAGDIHEQGKFKLVAGYDGIRRNRSDTYQTPFSGVGTNTLTLPTFWQVPTVAGSTATNNVTNVISARGLIPTIASASYIDTKSNPPSPTMGGLLVPTSAQLAQINAAAGDLGAFTSFDVYTKRTRLNVGLNYILNDHWTIDGSFLPEHKEGTKPMGTVSRNTGGDISTVIPDVVDSDHRQVNASATYTATSGFAQLGFYASSYTNHVPFMSWQNWATPTLTVNTISTAPSNMFGQVNGTGGYTFTPKTKLVVNGSYGRATQNDAFMHGPTMPVVPVSSLDGLVVTTALNARVTNRPGRKWNLAAGYKFNDRDNQTSVHIFQYADAEETPAPNSAFPAGNPLGPVVAQNANANRPYSRKSNLAAADAEYALGHGQFLKAGYDFERINRWCNNTWIGCADASITNENIARAEWHAAVAGKANARVEYAYSRRRTPFYNENAFLAVVPYANVTPATATDGATAYSFMTANGWTGWGPALSYAVTAGNMDVFFQNNNALRNVMYANNNRISELPGMRRYYVADRNRNLLRSALDIAFNDRFSLQGNADLTNDDYPSSRYGLQHSKGWATDIDGSYMITGTVSADAYFTYEDQHASMAGNTYTANSTASTIANGQPGAIGLSGNVCDSYTTLQQRNNNNKLDPCLDWTSATLDRAKTGGIGLRARAGKLDLFGDAIVSRARWDNSLNGGNWANNPVNGPGAAPTTIAAYFITATPLPTVTTHDFELRLSGQYALAHRQALHLAYAYMRMTSSDWSYEGMQIGGGTISGVLPTSEQPFNYRVHVISVSYLVTF